MAYDEKQSRFDFDFSPVHRYNPGDIFLGYDSEGQPAGYPAESHCIGIAGTGGGKTTAIMIPNILRTDDNVFCIDPTGKVSETVVVERAKNGRKVFVIDPLRAANVPDEFRASINPLKMIDRENPDRVLGDIGAIMKSLVVRPDPEDAAV